MIADRYPDIVKVIADQGHEIACHGNFHDDICDMDADQVYMSLKEAKDKLSELAKTEVRGFRAPVFQLINMILSDLMRYRRFLIITLLCILVMKRVFKYGGTSAQLK